MIETLMSGKAKAQQQALRHAALTGASVEAFQQLLKPQQLKSEACKTSSFSKLTGWKSSKASSTPACELDFIYEDDGGGTLLHYLCCGTSMWHLHNEAVSGPDTRLRRWQQNARNTAHNRVKALTWLLDPEQSDLWPSLPVGRVTHRCWNVLHCCVLNGGCIEALLLLLERLPPEIQKPDISLEDAGGHTPLHWALATHNWEAARILIGHGAIKVCQGLRVADRQVALALLSAPPAPAAPSFYSAVQALPASLRWFCKKLQSIPQLLPFTVMLLWQLNRLMELLATWFAPQGYARIAAMEALVAARLRATGPAASSDVQGSLSLQGSSAVHATESPCSQAERTGLGDEAAQFLGLRCLEGCEGETITLAHCQGDMSAAQEKPATAVGQLGQWGANVLQRVQTGGVDGWFGCGLDRGLEFEVLDAADAVLERAQAEEAHVAEVLQINDSTACQLLSQHSHDPLAALEAGHVFKLSSDASAKRTRVPVEWSEPGWKGVCAVCMEESPAAHFSVSMPCGHECCDACWCGILLACMDDGDTLKACCPEPACRIPLPLGFTFLLLPPREHTRWLRLQAGHYVQCSPDAAWCPFPGCGRSLHLHTSANTTTITTTTTTTDPNTSTSNNKSTAPALMSKQIPSGEDYVGPNPGLAACPASAAEEQTPTHLQRVLLLRWMFKSRGAGVQCMCGTRFCFGCSAPVHEPASCCQVEVWQRLLQEAAITAESDSASFISQNTKQCPNCRARVEKNGGCNHMKCASCKAEWCWACRGDWSLHGRSTGGFYKCNRVEDSDSTVLRLSRPPRGRTGTRRAEVDPQQRIFHEILPAFLHACEGRLTRIPAIAGRVAWLAGLLPESAGTAPRSNLAPEDGQVQQMRPAEAFLQAWLDCVSDSLVVLRSAHVLRFHTASAGACLDPGARYLESMTARLISITDQLLAPFERSMPHASLIPTQPLGAGSSGTQQGNVQSQPEGLLLMLLSAAGLVSGDTAATSTSSGGSNGNKSTLVRLHSRVQGAFKRFYGSGKQSHRHEQQEQQQEQNKEAPSADGTREENGHSGMHTPQPPPSKCPLLVVEPPRPQGNDAGTQILEQLMYTIALLQEHQVATVRESMREAAFVSECLIQGGRAGLFSLPCEGPTPHNPLTSVSPPDTSGTQQILHAPVPLPNTPGSQSTRSVAQQGTSSTSGRARNVPTNGRLEAGMQAVGSAIALAISVGFLGLWSAIVAILLGLLSAVIDSIRGGQ